jgi:hypothetical protein
MLCVESYRCGQIPTATGSNLKAKARQNKEFSGAERHFDIVEPAARLHCIKNLVPTSQKTDGLRYKKKSLLLMEIIAVHCENSHGTHKHAVG